MKATPTYNLIYDFDDVIYPFCQGITEVLALEGIEGTITQWALERDFGISREEFWEIIYQPKHNETLFLQPIDFELISQMRRLRYAGHRIHIVTARSHPVSQRFTREALALNNIPVDTLTFTKDKAPMVDRLNAEFSLDDAPHNYKAFNAVGRHHMTYLMDAPHNSDFYADENGLVRRIHSMTEFTEMVLAFQDAGVQMRGAAA